MFILNDYRNWVETIYRKSNGKIKDKFQNNSTLCWKTLAL